MEKVLEDLGLTHNEVKVYLALINNGSLSAGKITSKCGVHRRNVYDALDRLIEKGIVGYIKVNDVKEYSVSNPKELLRILKRQERDVNAILPKLEEGFNRTKSKKETVFYRGKDGIKHIFEDQLEVGKDILILGGSDKVYDLLKYYLPHYERERLKKKIKVKIIFDIKENTKISIPMSKIKYVEHSLGPSAINVYGNKVAIIVWSDNPYAILIDDCDVADSYRCHFGLLWKIAKK